MSQPRLDFDSTAAGHAGGDDSDDGEAPTLGVGELAEAINGALRRSFADGLWVRGEIQGWSERGPHAYFRLVEESAEGKASVNVQFFAPSRARLKPLLMKHRLRLADGLKVRIFGHLDFFAPSGQLGLKMSGIDPRFTLGELALQRDEVVRRLVAAGLYDRNRQCPLAVAPLNVGVVTSLASAAWADFLHEIERSGLGFPLKVIDVRVQGERAVAEVSAAIRTLAGDDELDVVAVVRGGGGRTELATFDHEAIATAIALSALPVFTGLGHEIDRAVADEVAHTALKTPTACAAALVEAVQSFQAATEQVWAGIAHRGELRLAGAVAEVTAVAQQLRHQVLAAVGRSSERLGQRSLRLRAGGRAVVERADSRLGAAAAAVRRLPRTLDPEARHLDAVAERVRLLDPAVTMARGWSITRTRDGRTVRSAAQLAPGDEIVTAFADGTARSRVEETTP